MMEVDFIPQSPEHYKILDNQCPDCGAPLKEYASGGLTICKICTSCGHRFSDMWLFGANRIKDGK